MHIESPFNIAKPVATLDVKTAPLAGNDFVDTIPLDEFRLYCAMRFTLTTDANAANRLVMLRWNLAGVLFYQVIHQEMVAASQTRYYHCGIGVGDCTTGNFGGYVQLPLPSHLIHLPGFDFTIHIENMQATDTINNIWTSEQRWRQLPR